MDFLFGICVGFACGLLVGVLVVGGFIYLKYQTMMLQVTTMKGRAVAKAAQIAKDEATSFTKTSVVNYLKGKLRK